jgi:hypothetical protein
MYATTIPNKPTPTGFKVWAIAQRAFLLVWNFHVPGEKGGPLGVKTPYELGGSKKDGKGGNKTQAVALSLVERLPKKTYHLWMDNLFTSTRFLELLRKRGFGGTGTCRTNSGVIYELVQMKKDDSNDTMPWGTTHSMSTESNLVCQTGWKDNAFALMMSTVMDGNEQVERERKRPKETSSKAKTARVPFGDQPTKKLMIPRLYDGYNYNMGAVDEHDNMTSRNAGLRPVVRGGHQAIEHWLFRVALVNSYLLSLCSDLEAPREVKFRSQQDFRIQLINSLLHMAKDVQVSPKRRISHMSTDAQSSPATEHEMVKMECRKDCVCCKGLRLGDRPQKRMALGEIAANQGRESKRTCTIYSCKQCDVALCKKRSCWKKYHRIE